MVIEYDINKPRRKYNPDIIKISNTCFVSVSEYVKRRNSFYDVVFNNNGKEIFLGRFEKDDSLFSVLYKNGKVLVCGEDFVKSAKSVNIVKVFLLYDIIDDVNYSVTSKEAVKLFDSNLNTDYIENKEKFIIRTDVEKRKRLKK